jgi:hypothetical protein
MNKNLIAGAALVATALFGTTACTTGESGPNHAQKIVNQQHKHNDKSSSGTATKAAAPKYTGSQTQAIGSATDYLDTQSFSRTGLIKQLQFEKFSLADATFAVDHIKVNWNVQAQGSAHDYLQTQSFSRGSLIAQLRFEGFTPAQAAYGATHNGL